MLSFQTFQSTNALSLLSPLHIPHYANYSISKALEEKTTCQFFHVCEFRSYFSLWLDEDLVGSTGMWSNSTHTHSICGVIGSLNLVPNHLMNAQCVGHATSPLPWQFYLCHSLALFLNYNFLPPLPPSFSGKITSKSHFHLLSCQLSITIVPFAASGSIVISHFIRTHILFPDLFGFFIF